MGVRIGVGLGLGLGLGLVLGLGLGLGLGLTLYLPISPYISLHLPIDAGRRDGVPRGGDALVRAALAEGESEA